MIENIGKPRYKHISNPSKDVLVLLEQLLKKRNSTLTVAEIGVGIGATSVEIVKRLRSCDSFHFFSYEDEVRELQEDLKSTDYCLCKLVPWGNSRKRLDSYNWNLAKIILSQTHRHGIYDLVYLDGGHSLLVSGLGCVLLKELVCPGGYLVFDDVGWIMAGKVDVDPIYCPETAENFTEEQINTPQIDMIVDLFMKNDRDWVQMPSSKTRAVFKKKNRNFRNWFSAH